MNKICNAKSSNAELTQTKDQETESTNPVFTRIKPMPSNSMLGLQEIDDTKQKLNYSSVPAATASTNCSYTTALKSSENKLRIKS